ncbi:MAG: O-antigen ligase family protein [Anaerolineae bacterium]
MTTQSNPSETSWRMSLSAFSALMLGVLAVVLLAYAQPALARLVIPFVLFGVAALAVTWRWPLVPLGLMLAFIPLYDGIVRYLTHVLELPGTWLQLLSLWKEGGLALLFGVVLIQHWTGRRRIVWRLYTFDLWLAALLLLSLFYIAIAARPGIGLYGLRNYVVPLAFFILARLMVTSRRDLLRLLAFLLAIGAGVAVFGIYQARTLDFPAMIALGYVDETGTVPYAFRTALRDGFPIPRAVSTTTGPNQFAVYLNFLILVCLFGIVHGRRRAQRVVLGGLAALYGVTLLLTLSRGGLLMLLVSLMAWAALLVEHHGVKRTWQELTQNRLLLAGLVALVVLGAAGVVASGFATRVVRGLTGRDPSADAHQSSMAYSLEFMAHNPLGIGMGMVGERALQFAGEANVEHTESTFFQVGMEMGLFGMGLLLVALVSLLLTFWRMRRRMHTRGDPFGQAVVELALVFWFGALANFVFTPLLQNLLAAGYLWWAAGVAFNQDAYADRVTG